MKQSLPVSHRNVVYSQLTTEQKCTQPDRNIQPSTVHTTEHTQRNCVYLSQIGISVLIHHWSNDMHRADSRLALNQWDTSLQTNIVPHWLGANLEPALYVKYYGDSRTQQMALLSQTWCWRQGVCLKKKKKNNPKKTNKQKTTVRAGIFSKMVAHNWASVLGCVLLEVQLCADRLGLVVGHAKSLHKFYNLKPLIHTLIHREQHCSFVSYHCCHILAFFIPIKSLTKPVTVMWQLLLLKYAKIAQNYRKKRVVNIHHFRST